MPNLLKLPTWSDDDFVHVVVETPRGARAKLKFDPQLKTFVLSKSLLLGLTYPYDWGFVPSTRAEDGDPLDVMVIHDAATTPGLVLKCKVIGVLKTLQKEKGEKTRNDRIFAVPAESHRHIWGRVFSNPDDAVSALFEGLGRAARIAVIPEGPYVLANLCLAPAGRT